MAKKFQVFISSTYEDLKTQRDEVVKTILRIGHLPIGMEMFNAGNDTQWEIIKRYIDNCDYYVVILAHRYGSEAPDGIGYTEKEYEYAQAQGIPCLGFIIHDDADWSPKLIAKGEQAVKLEAFKGKIKNRMVSFWRSTDNLALLVSNALTETFITHPRTGWVRATEAASPQVAEELARLSRENKELTDKLHSLQITENLDALESKLREITYELKIGASSKTYQLYEILMAVLKPDRNNGGEIVSEIIANDTEMFRAATSELVMLDLIFYEKVGNNNEMKMTQKAKRLYVKNNYSL